MTLAACFMARVQSFTVAVLFKSRMDQEEWVWLGAELEQSATVLAASTGDGHPSCILAQICAALIHVTYTRFISITSTTLSLAAIFSALGGRMT
jgi:hypothetical protein